MRVTLRDIAARANVSKQAVSAALRGRPSTTRVSAELRERILSTAREMGYQPNLLARALAEQRSGLFVTTCDNLKDPHFAETLLAVEQEVRAAGFTTCVLRPETDHPEADLLLYQMADAVLHLTHPKRKRDAHGQLAKVEESALAPCVVVSTPHNPGSPAPQFYWEEADGAREMQIDFDAAVSQRRLYAALLEGVRAAIPRWMPLSVTALSSWCSDPDWLDSLPVNEAVPMLFRMGPDAGAVRRQVGRREPFAALRCRTSVGLSTDEPVALSRAGRRVYLFHPLAWSRGAFELAQDGLR